MPSGLDSNVVTGGIDYGHVRRPIPVAKALDNALVALEMNGQPLPADHGFPARLIVPGWIGVANIKWIGQIEVSRNRCPRSGTPSSTSDRTELSDHAAPHDPGREERLGARPRRDVHGGHAAAPLRAGVVGRGRDQPGRRERRPRRHVDGGEAAQPQRPGNWSRFTYPCPRSRPATTSSGRAPPTTTIASSPRSRPSTPPAISSAQSSATRSLSASGTRSGTEPATPARATNGPLGSDGS